MFLQLTLFYILSHSAKNKKGGVKLPLPHCKRVACDFFGQPPFYFSGTELDFVGPVTNHFISIGIVSQR